MLVGSAGTGSAGRYSTGSSDADSVQRWCSTGSASRYSTCTGIVSSVGAW